VSRADSAHKRQLLKAFLDGAAHTGWGFGAATVSWAKKNSFIASVPGAAMCVYKITEAGRAEYARIAAFGSQS
jgi:hypothetical protein